MSTLVFSVLITLGGCRPTIAPIPTAKVSTPTPTAPATATQTPTATPTPPPPTSLPPAPIVHPLARASSLPVVYQLPGMEVVRVETDLTYKVVGRVELKMDIYYPSGSQEGAGHPAVIFVHGDAPVQHNIKNALPYLSWGRLAAASGMAAVTFNRRTSEPGDINDLIQYIREHAETFRIDENRLCVFAFSAGVPLGVTAVLPTPEFVRCIVAYYGDMRMPLSRLQQDSLADIAPFLIAKAARDEFIPSSSIDVFVNEALVRGVDVELLVHPTGVHAFDLRNDDDTSRAIITQTIRFMQAHLEIGQ